MPDIIVTTPKSQMAVAAQEAADCIHDGGGEYFRRFSPKRRPDVKVGDRVFYVEDGFLRGYASVTSLVRLSRPFPCDTTDRRWHAGFYVVMEAKTWKWIRPIPMRGFQGFRYLESSNILPDFKIKVVGDWLDPRPEVGG